MLVNGVIDLGNPVNSADPQIGLRIKNDIMRCSGMVSMRHEWKTNLQFSMLLEKKLLLGGNFVISPMSKNLDLYDFGVVLEPEKDILVGLKHQSVPKAKYGFGNVALFAQYKPVDDITCAAEGSFNFETKAWDLKSVFNATLFDELTIKAKLDKELNVSGVVFHKSGGNGQKTSISTSVNLKNLSLDTLANLQFGVGMDVRL